MNAKAATRKQRPTVDLIGAALAPPAIHTAITIVTAVFQRRAQVEGTAIGILSMIGSAVFGFIFLARRWRRYAIVIGIVYFPAMIALLLYVSLIVQGNLLSNWL